MSEYLWRDSKGQEYYFDYKIGKPMKEQDERQIEGLDLKGLRILKEFVQLEGYFGANEEEVKEILGKVKNEIEKKVSPYPNATDEELENEHFKMSRMADEGHDFLDSMQTIENELIRRGEIRAGSGIIYKAE